MLAGLSTEHYPKLERGVTASASSSVLESRCERCGSTTPIAGICSTSLAQPTAVVRRGKWLTLFGLSGLHAPP